MAELLVTSAVVPKRGFPERFLGVHDDLFVYSVS